MRWGTMNGKKNNKKKQNKKKKRHIWNNGRTNKELEQTVSRKENWVGEARVVGTGLGGGGA